MAISPGAFWRARPSSSSVQAHRLNFPARIRSARLFPGSGRNSPLPHSPLGQRLNKILAIHVAEAGIFAAIATAHAVVNGPVIFIAQWAWHGAIVTSLVANVKSETTTCFCLTPMSQARASAGTARLTSGQAESETVEASSPRGESTASVSEKGA